MTYSLIVPERNPWSSDQKTPIDGVLLKGGGTFPCANKVFAQGEVQFVLAYRPSFLYEKYFLLKWGDR